MPLVDIALVKKHLRVDFEDDDAEIEVYRDSAESMVVNRLDRPVLPMGATLPIAGDVDYDATAIVIKPEIRAAILLLAGHLYENREAVADARLQELPMSITALLAPYRIWRKFEEDDDANATSCD